MSQPHRFALLTNPGSRRAQGFINACKSQGLVEPIILPWEEWLSPDLDAARALKDSNCLRFDSPAENIAVERLLLTHGAEACRSEKRCSFLPSSECTHLPEDEGELRFQRQWYLGWQRVLQGISSACERQRVRPMNDPAEVATLFDKEATRRTLEKHDVPMPPSAGVCENFDDLVAKMDSHRWDRVFLKPCHGSSATGVMAIARHPRNGWQATTSAVLTGTRIRNSKRLRRIEHQNEIIATINAICHERALIERWFPKATWRGKAFDLRVLVIRGKATHVAVRTSSHPITNLHLHNKRGELQAFVEALGTARWEEAMNVALAAAAAFPRCHYCGVDLMVGTNHRYAVAEVNAFGDLLHRELWQGMNPWEAELALW